VTRSARASRHRSREAALQVLYAVDLGRASEAPGSSDPAGRGDAGEAFDKVAENFELPEGARAFAKELVGGVTAHREELDARIAAHARNWRVARMATVDRNVLRLAVFELTHSTTPPAVVIDEAVELARRFGAEKSPAFVNGILDAVARSTREPPA